MIADEGVTRREFERLAASFDHHLIQSADRAERQAKATEEQTRVLRDWINRAEEKFVDRELYEATTVRTLASLKSHEVWAASIIISTLLVSFVGVVTGAMFGWIG